MLGAWASPGKRDHKLVPAQGDLVQRAVVEPDILPGWASTSSFMSSRAPTPIFSRPEIRNWMSTYFLWASGVSLAGLDS